MNNELSMLSLRHIFLSKLHFGPEKQLHFRHHLSRYVAAWFVVTILMAVDFNNVYGVHQLPHSAVPRHPVCPRCTTALGCIQQVTAVFATPRNYNIPTPLFLGPVSTKGKVISVSLILLKVQNFLIHFTGTSGVSQMTRAVT